MANASVGIRNAAVAPAVQPTAGAKAPVFQARTSGRGSVALMIVGAAALLTGALIGDDAGTIIMVGGAAVGLYGLWQFLQ